jgi:hypothetical protein
MTSILRVNSIQNSSGNTILNNTGSVIRYADVRIPSVNDDYVGIAADTVYVTPVTITYTPLSASSRLVVKGQCQTRVIAALGVSGGINRDGVAINGSFQRNSLSFWYKGDSVNHHYDVHCQTSVIAGSTNPTTFTMFIQPISGSGEFNFGWGNMFIQVWEIAR